MLVLDGFGCLSWDFGLVWLVAFLRKVFVWVWGGFWDLGLAVWFVSLFVLGNKVKETSSLLKPSRLLAIG